MKSIYEKKARNAFMCGGRWASVMIVMLAVMAFAACKGGGNDPDSPGSGNSSSDSKEYPVLSNAIKCSDGSMAYLLGYDDLVITDEDGVITSIDGYRVWTDKDTIRMVKDDRYCNITLNERGCLDKMYDTSTYGPDNLSICTFTYDEQGHCTTIVTEYIAPDVQRHMVETFYWDENGDLYRINGSYISSNGANNDWTRGYTYDLTKDNPVGQILYWHSGTVSMINRVLASLGYMGKGNAHCPDGKNICVVLNPDGTIHHEYRIVNPDAAVVYAYRK